MRPHDRRFELINLSPGASTKTKRIAGTNFAPLTHKPRATRRLGEQSILSPNKEAVMKQLHRQIDFERMQDRKALFNSPKASQPEYEVNFEALDKHVKSPKLNMSIGRNIAEGPCFMHSVSSRHNFQEHNLNSLELSCYQDAFKPSVVSPQKSADLSFSQLESYFNR
jgi:hypothetical protein